MSDVDKKKEYLRMLDCPDCGSPNTSFRVTKRKMVCEKCGCEWERPQKPKG